MTTKELYFTVDEIEQQADELFLHEIEQNKSKGSTFQPSHSALLVLDMQLYFLEASSHAYIPSARAIIKGIVHLIEAYFNLGRPIVFTQHINNAEDAGMMALWWKDLITHQNPMSGIIPEIDSSKGIVIHKSQYDAFYRTQLEGLLRSMEVTQLVLCGVMTHLCCETTARSAFMRGFEVYFPLDGTATYRLDYHRASLLNLAHGFASIVRVKDILEAMRDMHED